VRAVLWDLDGTLVDSEPVHDLAFDAAVADLGLTVPHGFIETMLGVGEDGLHAALVAQAGYTGTLADWRAVKWPHFRDRADGVRRRDAVADVALRLHAQGVPMAVVSNSTRAEVDLNLSVTGLGGLFPVTLSRDDLRQGKPDPEGYLHAAGLLGLASADCLVVEDSATGARAGLAAGMTVIFHPQANHAPPDDHPRLICLAPDVPLWMHVAPLFALNPSS
jgi:HAD superfamily hydrolase (TIGR01509 family)